MNNEITGLSISNVVEKLSNMYSSAIEKNIRLQSLPSVFLWGPPGVGKSDGVRELAKNLELTTGRKVNVTDIRLLLFSPVDLRGVPVADAERKFTDWLMPRIFNLNESDDVINILFLDELSAATSNIQATAYQITLDHKIGEHKLPENTIVIAAGNRVDDNAVSYHMPSALSNRLMHFDIGIDFEEWKEWAVGEENINRLVLGFLSFAPQYLYRKSDENAFPSPRSWVFVSRVLNVMKETEDINNVYDFIKGCVGTGCATEFVEWCRKRASLPSIKDIFDGTCTIMPRTIDELSIVIQSIVSHLSKEVEFGRSISTSKLENMCSYCSNFPADYRMMMLEKLKKIGGMEAMMKMCESYDLMVKGLFKLKEVS